MDTDYTHINNSGFPFQNKVASVLRSIPDIRLSVFVEQRWVSNDLKSDGYIDIVAIPDDGKVTRLIIECKRLNKPNKLLFPIPRDQQKASINRFYWNHRNPDRYLKNGWSEFPSAFDNVFQAVQCIKPSGNHKIEGTFIETIGGTLLNSVRAFAKHESDLGDATGKGRVYIPVIITNAELKILEYDIEDVSLADGTIKLRDDSRSFSVPYLVFQKSMGAFQMGGAIDLVNFSQSNEKSILIVNSTKLSENISQIASCIFKPNISMPWID